MKDIKQRSRGTLRLQIARGTEEEVWAAFEELMRRKIFCAARERKLK